MSTSTQGQLNSDASLMLMLHFYFSADLLLILSKLVQIAVHKVFFLYGDSLLLESSHRLQYISTSCVLGHMIKFLSRNSVEEPPLALLLTRNVTFSSVTL